jgi:hypothetical protein
VHRGRDGKPLVLVVGDEAVPVTVGVTKKEGEGGCSWVLKKEHLHLSEVGPMLRVINEEKRDMDKFKGKRVHDFFLPPGSKILVVSYVHLRREGLDGYIADFNNMVRDVWGVTGDSGVEVLPVCPVVWEGLDVRGRELIHGLQDWIKWVGEVGGRESVGKLALAGGLEWEAGNGKLETYKPGFLKLQVKQGGGNGEWRDRGNCLSFVREDRREVRLGMVGPARELGRMVEAKLEESGDVLDREKDRRETFDKGVSVEAEYAFTKAVGEFCREAVKEGSFKGGYRMNVKEQMEERMGKIWSEGGKVRAVMVGGSQMGRLGAEVEQKGREAVEVEGWVKVRGRLDRDEMERVVEKVLETGKMADKVIVGGPGNSLFRHGSGEKRGFCPERTAKVERNAQGEVTRVMVEYHMTEPERVTLSEKRELIDRVVELFRRIGDGLPGIQLVYITMFPRHITRCCREAGHMSREDSMMLNGYRKSVESDIVEELEDLGVQVIHWFDLLGWDSEPGLDELCAKDVVCSDGVHLTAKANSFAAVSLCCRIAEVEIFVKSSAGVKKRRVV